MFYHYYITNPSENIMVQSIVFSRTGKCLKVITTLQFKSLNTWKISVFSGINVLQETAELIVVRILYLQVIEKITY